MLVLLSYGKLFVGVSMAKLLSPDRLGNALNEVLSEFSTLAKSKANKGIRRAAIKTFSGIVKMSPVGNPDLWLYNHPTRGYIDYVGYLGKPDYVGGRFRNNWFLGSRLTEQTTTETSSKGTGYISKDMPVNVFKSTVFFYNNLPYAMALEFGHSTQAPKGMVRLNVLKWKKNLRASFQAVK